MTLLATHPMRHRAKQAGMSNFWRMDNGAFVNDGAANVTLGLPYGSDTPSGWPSDWIDGAGLLYQGAYARIPYSHETVLPTEFGIFGHFMVDPGGLPGASTTGRTLMSLFLPSQIGAGAWVPEIDVLLEWKDGRAFITINEVNANDDYSLGASYPLGEGAFTRRTVYVAATSSGGPTRIMLMVPGQHMIVYDSVLSGEARFAGFGGADLAGPDGLTYHPLSRGLERNLSLYHSSLCSFHRELSLDEVTEWARLLELGQSSEGLLLPLNNSRAELPLELAAGDTLIPLTEAECLKFCIPGPNEEGRVTLVDPSDPDAYEVCALVANDLTQLELRRGMEGTEARAWPEGTRIRGLITHDLLRQRPRWVPEYQGPPSPMGYGISWTQLKDAPDIPSLEAEVRRLAYDIQNHRDEIGTLKGSIQSLTTQVGTLPSIVDRITALESRPTREDYNALVKEVAALKLRVAALEGGDVPDEFLLVDAQGNVLTDATGTALSAPGGLSPATLVNAADEVLVGADGVALVGQDMRLVDSGANELVDTDGAQLIAA